MTPIVSVTWDRFSIIASVIYLGAAVEFCLPLLTGGQYGILAGVPAGTVWFVISAVIGLIAFIPFTVAYAKTAKCRLRFTEQDIEGLISFGSLAFTEISGWRLNSSALMLWPAHRLTGRRFYTQGWRPGVPLRVVWAPIDPAKIPQIGQLMTERLGPPR